jgi:hypothetical protein
MILYFHHCVAYYLWIILAEVCKLKYSIKNLGEKIQALCMVFILGEIWTLKLMGFFFQKHLMFFSLWSTFFCPQNARFQELPPPWTSYGPQPNFLGLFFFTIPWLVCFFYFITSNWTHQRPLARIKTYKCHN